MAENNRGAGMRRVLGGLLKAMPLLFGLGFLAPLVAQLLTLAGWALPGGVAPLVVGLVIGGVWGGVATLTGRWL